ncbi:hypothetical protein [Chitinophaga arvensicola]|uniref:Uncharacterized protein n=1 Tax=Chitinophaga arvensicola TaxID=29529 RepID=A0A1I0S6W5_9BACT|nr:hypothetical protein [Chitinophaga arvensicola]SEW51444.1 hypothetical protein SAMN04488122_4242 [Chitinophaga arvensicola]
MRTILKGKYLLLFVLLTTLASTAMAQTDKWTGVWRMTVKPWPQSTVIQVELHIGPPEHGILYPAILKLQYGEFTGIYEVLLAKKNERQLGIGRNKFPLKETPYKLGIWTWYLNGTLDYGKDTIGISRMWIDKLNIWMRGMYSDDEIYESSKADLRELLYRDKFKLVKTGSRPMADSSVQRILHHKDPHIYYGIYTTIVAKDSIVPMQIADQEKYDQDTVTLLQNERTIFSREQINDQNRHPQARLDTGHNIFVFFADNYGSLPPNTGSLRMTIDGQPRDFDFSDQANAYATFLVADIYHAGSITPEPIKRTSVPVATIPVHTADIILELRDTRIQDGDSISLNLNGKWVVNGFPVKKEIQQIRITLQPGENILLFTADNLGSIPPNTAELKIRFGSESKVLNLSTDMKKNNEIRLVLE